MYKKIYNVIKKYNNIVISRHINGDPDAYGSELALRDSIKLTFPKKNVFAVGNALAKFSFMGKIDSITEVENLEDVLLIVLDTPDKKRVDMIEKIPYTYSVKIDHHPFMEKFCNIELISEKKSSASEMVIDLIYNTKLRMNQSIAKNLFCGVISDTNRFLFNNSTYKTFEQIARIIKEYKLDITEAYEDLYRRSFNEMQLLGYISSNMKITENGVGYIKLENSTLQKYNMDGSSIGSLINEFNNVEELLIWTIATEDVKNSMIKISIRSRGPVINKVAERYSGGGHKQASGARTPSFEEFKELVKDLDKEAAKYIERCDIYENN